MLTLSSTVTASGTKMAIGDAGIAGVLGYAIVFVGLIALMYVIILVGKIMVAKQKKNAAASAEAPAAPAQPVQPAQPQGDKAPGSCGELKLYDTDPKVAAMIMAIVADKMGKPLNELRFKSIKEVK